MTTPTHPMPTIREGSTLGLRFTVGTWCAIVGTVGTGIVVVIGFAVWLHTVYQNQERMQKEQERQAEVLNRIERSVSEIEFRQKYGITTSLPSSPKATP